MQNKDSKDFIELVDLCTELAKYVDQLAGKVENLESIARYQENQIDALYEEAQRLRTQNIKF